MNTDEGCGIIKKGSQTLLTVVDGTDVYDYNFLDRIEKRR